MLFEICILTHKREEIYISSEVGICKGVYVYLTYILGS